MKEEEEEEGGGVSSTHRGPIAVPLLVANVDSDQETHVGGHA